jgi:hypothetical protein
MSHPARRLALLLPALTAALACAVPASAMDPAPRIFGGKVLQSNAQQKWFLMSPGASKRYSQIKVVYDAKTRWTGPPAKLKRLAVGDFVSVTAASAANGAFRATMVRINDPKLRPSGAGGGSAGG